MAWIEEGDDKQVDPKRQILQDRVEYHMANANDTCSTGRYTAKNMLGRKDDFAFDRAKDVLIDTKNRVVKEIDASIELIDRERNS